MIKTAWEPTPKQCAAPIPAGMVTSGPISTSCSRFWLFRVFIFGILVHYRPWPVLGDWQTWVKSQLVLEGLKQSPQEKRVSPTHVTMPKLLRYRRVHASFKVGTNQHGTFQVTTGAPAVFLGNRNGHHQRPPSWEVRALPPRFYNIPWLALQGMINFGVEGIPLLLRDSFPWFRRLLSV